VSKRGRHSIMMLCLSALICALMVISTLFFRFPLPGTDVMFTFQVLIVLLCGLVFPLRYGLYAVAGYIVLGFVGFPVFSSVSGPGVVVAPSFGYLLGFPCAICMERIFRRRFSNKKSCDVLAALMGICVMYSVALFYIALLMNLWLKKPLGVGELFSVYCLAFLPLDIIKAILAALIAPRLRKALKLS